MTTAEEIKAFREKHSCSLFEAKDHFKRQMMLEQLELVKKYAVARPEDAPVYVEMIATLLKEILDEVIPARFDKPRSYNGKL